MRKIYLLIKFIIISLITFVLLVITAENGYSEQTFLLESGKNNVDEKQTNDFEYPLSSDNRNLLGYANFDEAREDTTLVTCYFDLNRNKPGKNKGDYFHRANKVLSLPNKFIIYVEQEDVDKIREIRERYGLMHRTEIVAKSFKSTYYYQFMEQIKEVMNSASYKQKLGVFAYQHVEYNLPIYDIVQFVKSELVTEAIQANYHNSSYFVWFDFGMFDQAFNATDTTKMFPFRDHHFYTLMDKVRVLSFPGYQTLNQKTITDIVSAHHDYIIGTIWGGYKTAVLKFAETFKEAVKFSIDEKMVGDDQDVMSYMYSKHPDLFDVIPIEFWPGIGYEF